LVVIALPWPSSTRYPLVREGRFSGRRLRLGWHAVGLGLLALLRGNVAAATHPRGPCRDEAHDPGRSERDPEAVAERVRDQLGEELLAGDRGRLVLRERTERFVADQLLHRVVAEEGGEEAADRRLLGDGLGLGGGHPVLDELLVHGGRERA